MLIYMYNIPIPANYFKVQGGLKELITFSEYQFFALSVRIKNISKVSTRKNELPLCNYMYDE